MMIFLLSIGRGSGIVPIGLAAANADEYCSADLMRLISNTNKRRHAFDQSVLLALAIVFPQSERHNLRSHITRLTEVMRACHA